MQIVIGDLWSELGRANVILVTTNAEVNKDHKLVMGRGAALEASQRFPTLVRKLGERLIERQLVGAKYGIQFIEPSATIYPGLMLGAFQVKYHWREKADLTLISYSARYLAGIAKAMAFSRFAMNFPGIGNGRLEESLVRPLLDVLPDNVFVYKKA